MRLKLKQCLFALIVLMVFHDATAFDFPFVISSSGALVYDYRTRLIWKRCSEGQTWTGNTCSGDATGKSLFAARLSISDEMAARPDGIDVWEIPTVPELVTIIECPDVVQRARRRSLFLCPDNRAARRPIIDTRIFPNTSTTLYRTTTPSNDPRYTTAIEFSGGSEGTGVTADYSRVYLRLVSRSRDSIPSRLIRGFSPFSSGAELDDAVRFLLSVKDVNLTWRPRLTPIVAIPYGFPEYEMSLSDFQQELLAHAVRLRDRAWMFPELSPAVPQKSIPTEVLNLEKGEFETTAAFQERRRILAASADKDAESRYNEALRGYSEAMAKRASAEKTIMSERADPDILIKYIRIAWDQVAPALIGDPELHNLEYNADEVRFTAVLKPSRGSFSIPVSFVAPLDKAKDIKDHIGDGSVSPKVTIRAFTSKDQIAFDLAFAINPVWLQREFDSAGNDIDKTVKLIIAHPENDATAAARKNILSIAKTSSQLQKLLDLMSGWPEATAGRQYLRETQVREFERAQREDTSSAYRRFIDNFGGPDPIGYIKSARSKLNEAIRREEAEQRAAAEQRERDRPRQLCEAQRATCLASCPRDRVFTTQPDRDCEARCKSVECW